MIILPSHFLAASASQSFMKPALIVLSILLGVLVLGSAFFTYLAFRSHNVNSRTLLLLGLAYAATLITLFCTILCFNRYRNAEEVPMQEGTTASVQTTPQQTTEETTEPATEPTEPAPTEPKMEAGYVDTSNPANWGIQWEIIEHGTIVNSYNRTEKISFGNGASYSNVEGIITFRGNNYRSGATYGTANVVDETITQKWKSNIGSLNGWPGSGWTGQPLIVRWDDETKSIMNLYNEKKEKDGLVEVIYATLDGYIYFYDLDDGSYTRDPVFAGMNFKGAGSLDPRGYPLMYVGSGDYFDGKTPRMYVISLIDGSILYERSGSDSFTWRSDWSAFDSSPLIHAESDTLIWPGESGILYTIKLNTKYDPEQGTITVAPEETVKTRYKTSRSSGSKYWLGYEPSAVIVDQYLYISENGGMFFCIDLNTMELVWAQDTKDDSNSTPVFEWDEDGNGYIYTAPSLHWTANSSSQGPISIYKLNAMTGEIVWTKSYDCYTVSGVSGGVQSTPLLGKPGTELEGMIFYTVARTPKGGSGVLVALDTKTGEVVWEKNMPAYTWSSPVAVYSDSGKAYIVVCDSQGEAALLNGTTGETLDTISLGSNVEASPAVFENTLVVGTRGQRIFGLKIS